MSNVSAVLGGFPRGDEAPVLIVSLRFAVGSLMFGTKVRSTGLVTIESIDAHQFGELEEIGYPAGPFQLRLNWFPLPATRRFDQKSVRSARISAIALVKPSAVRVTPQPA